MMGGGKGRGYSGYLTVYLSLVMALLLSLCLALIEGARSNAIRVEAECVTEIGLNSILAEYHRELFAKYNMFAIDSSYGTSVSGTEDMAMHLEHYLERNLSLEDVFLSDYFYKDFLAMSVDSVQITGASILSDENGTVFRRKAVEAIKDDCNLTLLQDIWQWFRVIEDNGLRKRDVAAEKRVIDEQIQKYNGREIQIAKNEWTTVQVENPTDQLEGVRGKGILKYVVEKEETISAKSLYTDNLILSRMEHNQVNKGNMPVSELANIDELAERFFFQEYLLRYMGHYGAEKEGTALSYQTEYLLAGKSSDVENLRQVVTIICAIREAANAMYLFSDKEKCAEAGAMAAVVTTVLLVPQLASLVKTALILGWAYAESLHDVEVLLSGGKIPLLKDEESWHYDIENALHMGQGEETKSDEGLGYEDYLRVMMMFIDIDTLTGRAMNMTEADIRLTPGNAFFRLDNCYDQVECKIQLKSKYGYEYEITRRKRYA